MDDLLTRLAESMDRIGRMCSEGRPPRMSIPADRTRDDDLFICGTIIAATSEITRLRAALAEAELDARRYRWLRENLEVPLWTHDGYQLVWGLESEPPTLDAAIDSLIATKEQQT